VPAPGLKHVRIPRKMLLHRLDAVERSQAAGRDTSGNPIEAWIQTYPSAKYPKLLRGFVNELHPHDVFLYQQAGIEAQYEIYIDRFDDGTVPDIGIRDRIRARVYAPAGATIGVDNQAVAIADNLERVWNWDELALPQTTPIAFERTSRVETTETRAAPDKRRVTKVEIEWLLEFAKDVTPVAP
jgi:hypothetical protein